VPVIDASVAIKWFVEEPDAPAAHRLLEAHATGETTLVAPDLIVYEVSNVLLHNPTFSVSEVQRSVERW
jgi:predicted nucleic acid-binding protein